MRKWMRLAAAALAVILLFAAFDCSMIVRKYEIDAQQLDSPIRIALVTDLHSCRYGENQNTLIDAVFAQNPDLVLLGGDIFDDDIEDDNAEMFLAGISGSYLCYYVTGNHEYWSGAENFSRKMAILEKYGIPVLAGDCMKLEMNGQCINLCGVDDPAGGGEEEFLRQLQIMGKAEQNDDYTILLSHRPEYWEEYRNCGFDLVLCGHAHGGQWRIPGLLNGLFAPDQGLFPEYAGGMYAQDGRMMIVSRGLARESTRIPRIFNRPELVMVELY